MSLLAKVLDATHQYRAAFWIIMVPICFALGWHKSIIVIFLYSTYANFASDLSAWVAKRAKDANES